MSHMFKEKLSFFVKLKAIPMCFFLIFNFLFFLNFKIFNSYMRSQTWTPFYCFYCCSLQWKRNKQVVCWWEKTLIRKIEHTGKRRISSLNCDLQGCWATLWLPKVCPFILHHSYFRSFHPLSTSNLIPPTS